MKKQISSNRIVAAWCGVLIVIPLLSVYGRPLQAFVKASISSRFLAGILLGSSAALLWLLVGRLKPQQMRKKWMHLLWAGLLFLVVPLMLSTEEERLHFIVFGVFGALSVPAWGLTRAIVISLMVSGLDELLQWWLPDRVGDLRDVLFNGVAALGGCLLVNRLWRGDEKTDSLD